MLALSRERVRRAALGLGILRRYAPGAVASPFRSEHAMTPRISRAAKSARRSRPVASPPPRSAAAHKIARAAHHGGGHAVARAGVRGAHHRLRARGSGRVPHRQQDGHARGLPSTSWRPCYVDGHGPASTWSASPGTCSARCMDRPGRSDAVGARAPSTSPAGTSIGQIARRARLEAARWPLPRPCAGVREWLVPGPTRSQARSRASRDEVVKQGLPRAQARSLRRGQRRAVRASSAARPSPSWPRCARPSGPTCRSWSRCTEGSRRRRRPGGGAARAVRSRMDRGAACRRKTPPRLRARARATRLPIATGERAPSTGRHPRRSSSGGIVDVVQVDLTHFGGFLRHEAPRRLGRRLLPADGAPQRVRSGGDDGQPPLRGGDAELQGARALQRLRRLLGAGPRGSRRRASIPPTAVSPCPSAPVSASSSIARPAPGTRARADASRLFEEGWERRGSAGADRGHAALMTAAACRAGAGRAGGARGRTALGRAPAAPALGRHHARPHPCLPARQGGLPERGRRPAGGRCRVRHGRWSGAGASGGFARLDWDRAASTWWPPSKRTARRTG